MAAEITLTVVSSMVTFTWVICLIFGPRVKDDRRRHKWEMLFFITSIIVLFLVGTRIFFIRPIKSLWVFRYQEHIFFWIQLIVTIALLVLAFAGAVHIFGARKRKQQEQLLLGCKEALMNARDVLNMYNKRFGPPEDSEKMVGGDWEENFKGFVDWVSSLDEKIEDLLTEA